MSKDHFSVAVIGSGPAGASCALSLMKNGAPSVALVDKAFFPRDKSCGDGIGPGAVQVFRSLGLGAHLANHVPIKFLSVSSPSGIRAQGPLPVVGGSMPVGYTIPRRIFDKYIHDGAIEAGAVDFSGNQVEDASFNGSKWNISLKNIASGDVYSITADYLIGADGARSKVRRLLDVAFNTDRHTGTAVRIYAESQGAGFDALQIDFDGALIPGYGWLFPIDKTKANIGVGIDLDNYRAQNKHLRDLLDKYKKALGGNISYDEGSYNAYILPYGSQLPRLSHPIKHCALIGDAGSMVNPLTGEGIFYSMYAGELLGRLLGRSVAERAPAYKNELAIAEYERTFRREFKQHYDVNWAMKEKVEDPAWCNAVINACKRDRIVLGDLIDLMMGDKKDIKMSTFLRIFIRNTLPFLP